MSDTINSVTANAGLAGNSDAKAEKPPAVKLRPPGIEDVKAVVAELETAEPSLHKVVCSRRLLAVTDKYMRNLAEKANNDYEALRKLSPELDSHPCNGATLKNYSKRGSYTYPAWLIVLDEELKAKKVAAVKNGDARKEEGKVDRTCEFIFSVSL